MLWLASPGIAQNARRATIREILDSRQVYIQNRQARENDVSTEGQTVRTASARTGLSFNARGGLRLGQRSALTVGSQCVRLIQGQVMIGGSVGRNGCVGRIEVRPYGTVYVMQLDEQNRAQVAVLEGRVEVFNSDDPEVKVSVAANQVVTTDSDGNFVIGTDAKPTVTPLSQAQIQTITTSLVQGFQVPLPDLDRVAFLQPPSGFASRFLQEALLGREGDFDLDTQKGEPALPLIVQGNTAFGIFTRTSNNAGTFTPSIGPAIPISVDFDNQTISIGGQTGISNTFGLSGNNASGTVVLQTGQVLQLNVFGVNKQEPPVGSSLPGSLTSGVGIRDR
ncbi:hypothetical protein [Alkalinema sp. FACHB-956]|uniref:hypothetical protein n=1 Tax=Alkalinema sp. FACHB-956 TaxID=2692768 RepID=UPI001688015B|nr:hypothetical protein [Alkalinema sp. FACHB-956]MBD2328186.1 hypothetical protein [Alkalinema sp. FACHB-956]